MNLKALQLQQAISYQDDSALIKIYVAAKDETARTMQRGVAEIFRIMQDLNYGSELNNTVK